MKIIESFKPQVKNIAKEKIFEIFDGSRTVSGETAALTTNEELKDIKGINDFLNFSENSKVEFLGLGKKSETGSIAIVPINFKHKIFDKNFSFEVKLTHLDGRWQITQVRNVGKVMTDFDEWKAAYLHNLNIPIVKEMKDSISVVRLVKKNQSDKWGFSRKSIIGVQLKNTAQRKINSYRGDLIFFDENGKELKTVPLAINVSFSPGEIFDGRVAASINQFIAKDVELYKISQDQLKLTLRLETISFDDGTSLSLYNEMPERLPSSVK